MAVGSKNNIWASIPFYLPRLADLIAGRKRVWLVYSHSWYTDPQGIITRYLDATLDKQAERAFNGLSILSYERR